MQIPLAEHIKCEGTLWPLQGGREETCPKQLRNSIGVARAAALMDRDAVNAVGMGDCIVDRHGKGVKKGTPGYWLRKGGSVVLWAPVTSYVCALDAMSNRSFLSVLRFFDTKLKFTLPL